MKKARNFAGSIASRIGLGYRSKLRLLLSMICELLSGGLRGDGNRGFGGLGKIACMGVLLKINEEGCEVKRIASKTL